MMDIKSEDIGYFKELIEMKNNKPTEYKQFFKDLKEVILDMAKIGYEIANELEDLE